MTSTDDESTEEIFESFLCCVCLEVLYKPIVLSCGHISCFWCVHKSMNGLLESHCPICRDPYLHFPSVCQKLHCLLHKMYPTEYKKRGEQILMEEQDMGYFSPQFVTHIDEPKNSGISNLQALSTKEDSHISNCKEYQADENSTLEEKPLPFNGLNGKSDQISIADLLCEACEQLLFRPVVLNCGHVYCEACVGNPEGANKKIRCRICQILDPRGFPRVCLELEHFIQDRFPKDYAARRPAVDVRQNRQSKASSSESHLVKGVSSSSSDKYAWWAHPDSSLHIGVGCDSCGICPIIGDRYKCEDCTEEIGYDLCGECYNSRSKLPGRFNQQHTSDHKLRLVDVPTISFVPSMENGVRSLVILNVVPEASEISDTVDDDEGHSGGEHSDHVDSGDQNNLHSEGDDGSVEQNDVHSGYHDVDSSESGPNSRECDEHGDGSLEQNDVRSGYHDVDGSECGPTGREFDEHRDGHSS